jgi:Flp pilus assembly protein TadG
LLPLIALLLLGVAQVAVVAARQVAVTHAAREAARAAAAAGAAADDGRQAALSAASLDPSRLDVTIVHQQGDVRATVTFHDPTDVPVVGPLIPDVDLVASVSFREELNG